MTKKKQIILLVLLLCLGLFGYILSIVFKPAAPTWDGLTPGTTIQTAEIERLGAKPATISGSASGMYEFVSDIPSSPNVIKVDDQSNTIKLIAVEEPIENPTKFQSLIKEFGRPQLTMFRIGGYQDEVVYAYPGKGLAFFVHKPSDTIFRRWYFSPMSESDFLLFSKDSLTTTAPTGERYGPIP